MSTFLFKPGMSLEMLLTKKRKDKVGQLATNLKYEKIK